MMPATAALPHEQQLTGADSRSLRVAYAIDSLAGSGGTELHAVRLAEHASAAGVHAIVITLNPAGPMAARYAAAGVPVHAFPVPSLVGLAALRQVRAIARLLRTERIDVVHAHDCYTNFLVTLAGRLAGVPLVIASKRWTRNLHARHGYTNRVAYRAAHLVIANSKAVAATVQSDEGIPAARIRVMTNFLDDSAFTPLAVREREIVRTGLGYEPEHVVFAIVAQLRPEKDHAFLLRAFGEVVRREPQARLLVIGDGPEHASIDALRASLGMEQHVRMAGHVAAPRTMLGAVDVAVLSSQHEGFPNALLEAMAQGRPVVSTAVGGVVDAVTDGEDGLLVQAGDQAGFSDAMLRLAQDAPLRARLGSGARRTATTRYRADAAVQDMVTLYGESLAGRKR